MGNVGIKSHVDRPLVYQASPFQFPNPIHNSHDAIVSADTLDATGLVTVYVPHLNLVWDLVCKHTPEFWYSFDLAILAKCNALLRIPGKSQGADDEVRFA